ncbi:hypothetical protein ACFFRE_02090 [Aciditerrimonas ferrireducens]|uniref:Uncharacterized protein n=1 Tax=Aciditerrimonas ferrireducens TaxID=667306 RepID=A0ABV6BZT6_9ACTN
MHHLVFLAASGGLSPVSPTSSGLPIASGVNTILSWLMWGALILCGAGALISGGVMAFANHSARPDLSVRAKTGMLWSLGGAFLVGVAIPLVNAFYHIA